jgi:hypothetical protein
VLYLLHRERLIKIGTEVSKHSRYAAFQMAEVAVLRAPLREIREPIGRLRAKPELVRAG